MDEVGLEHYKGLFSSRNLRARAFNRRFTTGHSEGGSTCWGRVWRSAMLTQTGGSFSSIRTWAFRFLYTNSISFSASLPQINTTGQVSPRGCCSCRRESAHRAAVSCFSFPW